MANGAPVVRSRRALGFRGTPRTRRSRRAGAGLGLLLTAALMVGLSPLATADPTSAPEAPPPDVSSTPGTYIVTLADAPIAAYSGGVPGIKATRPSGGRRVDVHSTSAQRYRSYLQKRQNTIAARVGVKPKSRYEVSLAAFTARMTAQQAKTLASTSGVVSVTKDVLRKPTNDRNSVDYLGLSGKRGVWSTLGGSAKAGRGVVVGVIDTGIWPESPSFAAPALKNAPSGKFVPYRNGKNIVMTKSDGSTFSGVCQTGQEFTRNNCSTKLVGARYFADAWLANVPPEHRADYLSPRDGEGHGSHTASTAAGKQGVSAVVDGRDFGKISGVAPAAKIAVYKALWEGDSDATSGGYNSDIIAAIDAAISDGVDVINFSVSGADDPSDPTELAFLSAASAGIFVAVSAGNSGPGASTIEHSSPWLTSVGASTLQSYYGTVALGNGKKYVGISTSVTAPVGPAPLANASTLAAPGKTVADATLCIADSLDPAKVAGKIVVCDRGSNARVDKSAEVKRAGGLGMVLANVTENSLDGDLHSLPSVIVNPPASTAIKAYADTAGATATLTEGNQTKTSIPYPQIAIFSSRGPSLGTGGDTLKPDLTAPGVTILAAVAPASDGGRNFDFYSGTSMASPHVAGLAAIYYGASVHPRWSPMRVKSALMTTARNLKKEDGSPLTDPYTQGAGEVVPTKMLNPGLVYPSGDKDWLGYLEGLGVDTGTGVRAIDPSDYNSPSIAIGSLLQRQTVTRRVTALKPGLYRATASIPGVKVTVSPSILSFNAKGETKTFRVSFDNRRAPFNEAASGFLTWKGAGTSVRIPMAVTPKVVNAPDEVTGSGASGTIRYTVTPGVGGAFPIKASGLATGTAQTADKPAGSASQFTATVPSGAKVAQFTVRTPNTGADLDLYLFQIVNGVAVQVGQSATPAANETIVLPAPEAGTYVALVNVFANAPNTTSTPFTFRAASVAAGSGLGNFRVSPANPTATVGKPIALTASWSGVDASSPYLGWIEYKDGSGTIVSIN